MSLSGKCDSALADAPSHKELAMSCVRWIVAVGAVAVFTSWLPSASAQGLFGGNLFRGSGGQRINNNGNNNGYYEQPATYYAPVAPAPAPASAPAVTEVKPKENDALALDHAAVQAMNAKLAGRQQNHASQAGIKLNAAMEQYLAQGARGSAISNIAQAQQEWREAVVSKDPKDFRKFQTSFKLAPEQRMWLDTRITLLQYEHDLKSGYLTQAGKDARLDEIQKSVAMWPTSATKAGVQESLSESGKFSDLSKLVDLAPTADNSLQLVFSGFQSAKLTADDMSDLTGLPIMGADAIDDSTVSVGGILLMNPEENGETVNYNIGTYGYTMKPGEKQSLTQSYVVSFDPGDGTAVKKVTLTSGVYQFVLLPGAWELRKITPKIQIDNSRHHAAFHYLINGKEASVEPYRKAEHTDSGAMVIQFDRGDGGALARKVVASGTLVVGVDPEKLSLDLFNASDAPATTVAANGGSQGTSSVANDARTQEKQIQEALARLKARGN
jgi:hypothetical protein